MLVSKDLMAKKCQPCGKTTSALSVQEARDHLAQVPAWTLAADGKNISRDLMMKDFLTAVRLVNQIAQIAESEDHHPDLHLTNYRKLRIELATHSIGGLSENDFILAAKIEGLPKELKKSA